MPLPVSALSAVSFDQQVSALLPGGFDQQVNRHAVTVAYAPPPDFRQRPSGDSENLHQNDGPEATLSQAFSAARIALDSKETPEAGFAWTLTQQSDYQFVAQVKRRINRCCGTAH